MQDIFRARDNNCLFQSHKQPLRSVRLLFCGVQWILVIRTPSGVGKYVLITGINYTVDRRTVFQKMILISGMFLYHVFL